MEEWKRLWNQYDRKLREREEKRNYQQQQLQDLRQRYADDRWDRISKFAVNRIVQHDETDRHGFGLPAELDEDPNEFAPKTTGDRRPKDVNKLD